jgi:hypothetical protein
VKIDNSNGASCTVTYRITPRRGGIWDSTDNGSYSISLESSQVSDTSGNFAVAAPLGSFLVDISNSRYVRSASGGSNGSVDDFSFNLDLSTSPDSSGVFRNAITGFRIGYLLTGGRFPVAENIFLGDADLTSSIVESSDGTPVAVKYTATFANYSGNLLSSFPPNSGLEPNGAFTLSSNKLEFFVSSSNSSSLINSLAPLEVFGGITPSGSYFAFYGTASDAALAFLAPAYF